MYNKTKNNENQNESQTEKKIAIIEKGLHGSSGLVALDLVPPTADFKVTLSLLHLLHL